MAPKQNNWGKLTRSDQDRRLFAGPRNRLADLVSAISVFIEFIKGYRKLHFIGPCVTIFGSARFDETNSYYQLAREVSFDLGQLGFSIMTGGGPGIMEAANRGAKESGAPSIGCNITLPMEQKPNKYLDHWVEFKHFFVRKVMLIKYSYAFIALPGGYGTMDEIFETATLIQTKKIQNFPIILMGSEYWSPLLGFLKDSLIKSGAIDIKDFNSIFVSDSPKEVAKLIEQIVTRDFGLTRKAIYKPRWWLFEYKLGDLKKIVRQSLNSQKENR